jgi:catalase
MPCRHLSQGRGDAARSNHRDGNDDVGQKRALFLRFDAARRQRLYATIANLMVTVPADMIERQRALFDRVHPDYGAGVRPAVAAKTGSGTRAAADRQRRATARATRNGGDSDHDQGSRRGIAP